MSCWLLLLLSFLEAPQVDVTTLAGDMVTGRLTRFDGSQLELDQNGNPVKIPAAELLLVQRSDLGTGAAAIPSANTPAADPIVIELLDGSRLQATTLELRGDTLSLEHPQLGSLKLPRTGARSIRLGKEDPAVNATWKELQQRSKKQDYLVIRKGDVLDHLDGVVGEVDEATVKFLLDGEQIDVKRPRVYGWIYAQEAPKASGARVRVELPQGESLSVTSAVWEQDHWLLTLPGEKTPLSVPATAVNSLDFSAGKVLYLSKVEPRDVEHTPFFPGPGGDWPYQRDRNLFGRPLKVGTRTFSRGLAVHSKTRLLYRLGGDYRRLTSLVGLDPELSPNFEPAINNARLVISGDKKVLLETNVKAGDPPLPLDLNVANVIELEILVDFGEANCDIGDRVHLADLKVLK